MGRTSDAKQRLMDAVLELIWTGSYGATTIDLICEKAGVKKGSFYYFFDSKTELTAAALEDSWERIYRPIMDGIYSPSKDPCQRLKDHADSCYEEQVEKYRECGHVLGCPLFTLGNEISTQENRLREVIEKILTTHGRYVESTLREAAGKGDIHCTDPALTAKTLFLFWEGALAEARIKNDPNLLKNLWPSMQSLLGISPAPGTKPALQAA
jgi:TetR/AcrR family transcriptional repressor of nem operon